VHTLGLLFVCLTASAQLPDNGVATCQHTRLNYFGSLAKSSRSARIQYPGDATIDVTYYKLDLNITYTPNYLRGVATVGLTSQSDNLSRFFLDLANEMKADSVKTGAQKLAFSQENNQLSITPIQPLGKNQKLTVTVYYQGKPGATGLGSFTFGTHGSQNQPAIWSLSEPYGARDWFPCKQSLTDKIDSADIFITVPTGLKVASNGILRSIIPQGSSANTFEWASRNPVDYYLLSFAVAPYVEYNYYMHFSGSTDSMLVQNFIYNDPAILQNNQDELDSIGYIIDHFSTLFGRFEQSVRPAGVSEAGGAFERYQGDRVTLLELGARSRESWKGLSGEASIGWMDWRDVQADIVT
ncbi:MAG: hypothetical protein EOP50_20835, partial [Sphingobacteriales bacterium]